MILGILAKLIAVLEEAGGAIKGVFTLKGYVDEWVVAPIRRRQAETKAAEKLARDAIAADESKRLKAEADRKRLDEFPRRDDHPGGPYSWMG